MALFKKGENGGQRGGARPRAGSKSKAMQERFQQIFQEAGCFKRLKLILIRTKDDHKFMQAMNICLDRGWGKPKQELEHTGESLRRMVLIFPGESGYKEQPS